MIRTRSPRLVRVHHPTGLGLSFVCLVSSGCSLATRCPPPPDATPPRIERAATAPPVTPPSVVYPIVSDTILQACADTSVAGIEFDNRLPARPDHIVKGHAVPGQEANVMPGDCTTRVSLELRRRRSTSATDHLEKETLVTRNLNRELANVNAVMLRVTDAGRLRYASLLSRPISALPSPSEIDTAHQATRIDLAWAKAQRDRAIDNLAAQRQIVTEKARGSAGQALQDRLFAEISSLATHVSTLERLIGVLSSYADAFVRTE